MIRDSFLLSITTICSLILGIAIQFFLSRYLEVSEYGAFQYVLSWIGILSILSLPSFNQIVIKAVSQGYSRFYRINNQIRFLFSIIGLVIFLIMAYFGDPTYSILFFITAFFFPFYTALNATQPYLLAKKEFRTYGIFMIASQIIVLGGTIITVITIPKVTYVLFVFLLLYAFNYSIISIYYHRKEINQKIDTLKEQALLKYGFQLSGIGILPIISDKLQFIILEYYGGLQTLAIYAVVQIFPERINGVLKSFISPVSIFLSEENPKTGVKFLKKSTFFYLLFGFLGFLISIVLVPLIIKIVFGSNYDKALTFTSLFCIPIITMPLLALYNGFMINHNFKRRYLTFTLSKAAIKLLFYFILIPKYQIYGIAIALIMTDFILILLYFLGIYKKLPIANDYKILTFDKSLKYINEHISIKFNGNNIIKVLYCDEVVDTNVPFWAKLIGIISFTKFKKSNSTL